MIWNRNCRRIRPLLALWAGSDLEQHESQSAERHLAVCPACREVWQQLQQSQHVLEQVRSAPLEQAEQGAIPRPAASVWPWVLRHVRSLSADGIGSDRATVAGPNRANWRDWLPAGAIAAACLGIIVVTVSDVPVNEGASPSVIMSSHASDANPRHLGPFPLGLYRGDAQHSVQRPTRVINDEPPNF